MAFITNGAATLAFTSGSTTVAVTGTNPILEGVLAGDLAVHPSGALPIAAFGVATLTLVLPAPSTVTVAFNIMLGPSRSLVALATQVTRDVWAQINAWADRGLSIPVIAQQNAPPSTPADLDRYLVGTAGSGAWASRNNQFATWSQTAGSWLFVTPSAGWQATINGEHTRLVFSGSSWASTEVDAGDVAFTPAAGIAADNVQAAIQEIAGEVTALDGTVTALDGTVTALDGTVTALDGVVSALRQKLASARTYHVSTTGNDTTGDGSSGAPWLTMQKAVNFIAENLDLNGYQVTVSVAAGSYAAGAVADKPWVGGGSVLFRGPTGGGSDFAIVTATNCFESSNRAVIYLEGRIRITASALGVFAIYGGHLYYKDIDFGAQSANGIHVYATRFGYVEATGGYTISGGGGANHVQASHHGNFRHAAGTLTLLANVSFSLATHYALTEADITLTGTAAFALGGFAVTAPKFLVDGATIQWATKLPSDMLGTAIGVEQNGGRFIAGVASEVFTGTTAYNLAGASGSTVTVTGLPHIPGEIEIFAGVGGANWTQGWSVGSASNCTAAIGATTFITAANVLVYFVDISNYVSFVVSSRSSGGFVLTATKVGTPTGTLDIRYKTRRGL